MILRDYHIHTNYCDSNATAEEVIVAAIEQGLEEIGFSGHSHTSFDTSYCMSLEDTVNYRRELEALREKYADRISIKIGLEMDNYADADLEGIEYLIGSVHYIRLGGGAGFDAFVSMGETIDEGCLFATDEEGPAVYIPVDETVEILKTAADRYFGGDMIAFAEEYFRTVAGVAEKTGCDIIGHFDLISKFNGDGKLFDEEDPRYVAAWKSAVDRLVGAGVPFEINTGAISKGYRSDAYPSAPIREYIREKGGSFILSSDSHSTSTLCYAFDRFEGESDCHRL